MKAGWNEGVIFQTFELGGHVRLVRKKFRGATVEWTDPVAWTDSIVNDRFMKTPHVSNCRNCRFDVIFVCFKKRPGGSASNRVFTLSILKNKF